MSDCSPMLRAAQQTVSGLDVEFGALQRRTIRVLIAAQLLGALGLAAGGTAGSLLAAEITGSETATGLPLAVLVLGSGVGAIAVTRIMERTGRRTGLATAHLSGALGGGVVVAAAVMNSWPLMLLGCGLLGGGNSAVMLARYAAADLSSRSGRSISAVVTAASVGAVIGPNLLGATGSFARSFGLPGPTGLFLLAIPAFAGAALILLMFLRPDPLQVSRAARTQPAPADGDWAELLTSPDVRLGLLVLGVVNLAMVAVMAVGPVHMHVHGAGLGLVGLVISIHIAAMFVPSPLAGWLSDVFGARVVVSLGALLLAGAGAVVVLAGSNTAGIVVALLLLGAGWNAGLIGGSTLLRGARLESALRTRAEGLGELGMGAAAAIGGGGAGLLLAAGGFALVGLAAATPCLLLLAVVGTAGRGGIVRPRVRTELSRESA